MAAAGSVQLQSPSEPPLPSAVTDKKKRIRIRPVWSSNVEKEFILIRQIVDKYPFISIDTEFPGVVYRRDYRDYNRPHDVYKTLKSNVDALKLIQVGITLTDAAGNLPDLGDPHDYFIWEFNFCDFDVLRDDHDPGSIDLLRQQGINFDETRAYGISSNRFAELMMSSGLVCNDDVTYISFHSAYDFGYLIKVLTGLVLPASLETFLELMRLFFGRRVIDVKHLITYSTNLHGGLDRVAGSLGLTRAAGKSHQAGSDSLLTWHSFQRIRENFFNGDIKRLENSPGHNRKKESGGRKRLHKIKMEGDRAYLTRCCAMNYLGINLHGLQSDFGWIPQHQDSTRPLIMEIV